MSSSHPAIRDWIFEIPTTRPDEMPATLDCWIARSAFVSAFCLEFLLRLYSDVKFLFDEEIPSLFGR